MGLADMFSKEERVAVTFTDFYRLMRESAKCELLMNAVNCDLHPMYIRAMATGDKSQVRPIEESLLADMTDDRK